MDTEKRLSGQTRQEALEQIPADQAISERLIEIRLGASAGALGALRSFLAALPHDTGMTFLVLLDPSPDPESAMAALLQGATAMPVQQVQARIKIEPNHIYVIPPGKRPLVTEGYLELAAFELPQSEARLRLALDAAAMGSFTWYPAEDRTEPDERMLALFGLPLEGTLNLSEALAALIHPADRDRYAAAVGRSIAGEGGGELREEIRVIHPGGVVRWVAVTARTAFAGDPQHTARMVGVAADITERKRAEEALRQSEEQHAFLLKMGDALRPLADPVEIQAEAVRLLGAYLNASRAFYVEVEPDEDHAVIHRDYTNEGVPSAARQYRLRDFGAYVGQAFRAGRTLAINDGPADPRLDEADKVAYMALGFRAFAAVPLIKNGRLVAVLGIHQTNVRDWSADEVALIEETAERTWAAVERARAEAALRQLNEQLEERVVERTLQVGKLVTELTMSEQEERRRISSILHDDLQQRLFSLLFQTHLLGEMLKTPDLQEATQVIRQIEAELRSSVQITRDLSVDLSPPILHDEGLVEAMHWLASRMQEQYGLVVEVQTQERIPRLKNDLHVLFFQIVRELLFNVVKHAGVNQARVILSHVDGEMWIEVSDQGKGFRSATESQRKASSQGLQRIEQRLQLLGGHMQISSTPGEGTHITLYCPLQGSVGSET